MKFSKKDLIFSVATGCITGFAAWKILAFLGRPTFAGHTVAWLMLVMPILWIIGVNLGYFLGRWLGFFNQFGKFVAIGFTNAAVDYGVLNILIAATGIAAGAYYSLFKATSFVAAVVPSYFWNKYWAFEAGGSDGKGFEFAKFIAVALVATFVNNVAASITVNYIHPLFGFNPKIWANVGAIVGSAAGLVFSFAGFKVAVFKK